MKNMWNCFVAFFVAGLLMVSAVSAGIVDEAAAQADLLTGVVDFGSVRVNGDEITNNEVLSVEEGQTLNLRIGIVAVENAESGAVSDIEVTAKISGYEYSDYENLDDATHLFDIAAGTTKYVNLAVTLPKQLEKNVYWLRLNILNMHSVSVEKVVQLNVEPTRHGVDIADVSFSPGNTIKAGRALLATVLLENYGDKTEKDVKVTVAIPALGVSATEFVDVVETDDLKHHEIKLKKYFNIN